MTILTLFCFLFAAFIVYDSQQKPNTNECYIYSDTSPYNNVVHKVIRKDTRWYISRREVAAFNNYNEAVAWQNKYCENKVSFLDIK